MSTVITVSGWPKDNDFVQLMRAWLCGGVPGLRVERATIHQKYWRRDRVALSDCALPSIADSIEERKLFEKNEAVVIDCTYALRQFPVMLSLIFVGMDFDGGRAWKVDGQAFLKTTHGAIGPELRRAVRRLPSVSDRSVADSLELAAVASDVTDLWADLFMDFCLLTGPLAMQGGSSIQEVVEDAAMYLEAGWPSPLGCAMLYHRSRKSFIHDFRRALMIHREGIGWPQLRSQERGRIVHNAKPAPLSPSNLSSFYGQFDHGTGAVMAFLDRLRPEDVAAMAALSDGLAGDLLSLSTVESDECFVDLGTRGAVLFTDPLSSIWRVYARMLASLTQNVLTTG